MGRSVMSKKTWSTREVQVVGVLRQLLCTDKSDQRVSSVHAALAHVALLLSLQLQDVREEGGVRSLLRGPGEQAQDDQTRRR